ncbi:MAG TPA: plastocyanin/azurin family copper-binding protein [Gemmatimonadaceae bacterium]|nr:plastocyanin/azurin family copper-binding protein [Gemmatimonadaceae bacterium]
MRVLSFVLVVGLTACGSDSPAGPSGSKNKTVDIFTIGDAFSPAFATVTHGDTVRWNFAPGSDGMGHNVRFTPATAGAPADINVLKTGTASRVFTTPGSFSYVCDVHPGMNGGVSVQ